MQRACSGQPCRAQGLACAGPTVLAQAWGLDLVMGLLVLVADMFCTWGPDPIETLSQYQLQACVKAMFAALPSAWQEAAKQWHNQQAQGSNTCPPSAAWTAPLQKARSGQWWGAWVGPRIHS